MKRKTATLLVVFATHSVKPQADPPETLEKILELASNSDFSDIIYVGRYDKNYVPEGMDPYPVFSRKGEINVDLGGTSVTLAGGNLERVLNTFESTLRILIKYNNRKRVHVNLPLKGIYLESDANRITAQARYAELEKNPEVADPVRHLFADFIKHAEHEYPNYALQIAYDGNIAWHKDRKKGALEIILHIDRGENVK
jgi:hypothetical protein